MVCLRNNKQGGWSRGRKEKVVGEVGQVAGALLRMTAFFKLTGTYLLTTE